MSVDKAGLKNENCYGLQDLKNRVGQEEREFLPKITCDKSDYDQHQERFRKQPKSIKPLVVHPRGSSQDESFEPLTYTNLKRTGTSYLTAHKAAYLARKESLDFHLVKLGLTWLPLRAQYRVANESSSRHSSIGTGFMLCRMIVSRNYAPCLRKTFSVRKLEQARCASQPSKICWNALCGRSLVCGGNSTTYQGCVTIRAGTNT